MLSKIFDKYWIRKSEDPEEYWKLKKILGPQSRGTAEIKDYLVRELGFEFKVTRETVKIVKRPHRAFSWMGIDNFKSKDDYVLFMFILAFLIEQREAQFTFRDIKRYMDVNIRDGIAYDWTYMNHKRAFVRAMEAAEEFGLFQLVDGNVEADFLNSSLGFSNEVALYHNTFLASEYIPDYNEDLVKLSTYEDFSQNYLEPYRGTYRNTEAWRRIINRELALTPALYRSDDEGTFTYLLRHKSAADRMARNLELFLGRNIDYTTDAAFAYVDTNRNQKGTFSGEEQYRRIIMSINKLLREKGSALLADQDDKLDDEFRLTETEFFDVLKKVSENEKHLWTMGAQKMDEVVLSDVIKGLMIEWKFLATDNHKLKVRPSVAKIIGQYAEENLEVDKDGDK
jgi:uncharacterized protein (TIGR02678 family)